MMRWRWTTIAASTLMAYAFACQGGERGVGGVGGEASDASDADDATGGAANEDDEGPDGALSGPGRGAGAGGEADEGVAGPRGGGGTTATAGADGRAGVGGVGGAGVGTTSSEGGASGAGATVVDDDAGSDLDCAGYANEDDFMLNTDGHVLVIGREELEAGMSATTTSSDANHQHLVILNAAEREALLNGEEVISAQVGPPTNDPTLTGHIHSVVIHPCP